MGAEHRMGLVDALQNLAGDGLRVVAEYDRNGYDVLYMRDGLEGRVEKHATAVHHELVLQGIGREHLEDLFLAGDLHCSMHRFDDITAFHFPQAEYTGFFISIDADTDVDLSGFTETVRAHVE